MRRKPEKDKTDALGEIDGNGLVLGAIMNCCRFRSI